MSFFDDNEDFIIYGGYEEIPRTVECKRCGKDGLHWEDDNGKWRLFKGCTPHVCDEDKVQRNLASEFRVIK